VENQFVPIVEKIKNKIVSTVSKR